MVNTIRIPKPYSLEKVFQKLIQVFYTKWKFSTFFYKEKINFLEEYITIIIVEKDKYDYQIWDFS